jgi:hypothetical protein
VEIDSHLAGHHPSQDYCRRAFWRKTGGQREREEGVRSVDILCSYLLESEAERAGLKIYIYVYILVEPTVFPADQHLSVRRWGD